MEQDNLQEIWENIKNELKNFLAEKVIETWISPAKPISFENETMIVSVQTNIAKEYIEKRYIMDIKDAAKNVIDQDIELKIERVMKVLPQISYAVVGIVLIFLVLVVLVPAIEMYMGDFLFDAYLD